MHRELPIEEERAVYIHEGCKREVTARGWFQHPTPGDLYHRFPAYLNSYTFPTFNHANTLKETDIDFNTDSGGHSKVYSHSKPGGDSGGVSRDSASRGRRLVQVVIEI